jgi:hypothetical protein
MKVRIEPDSGHPSPVVRSDVRFTPHSGHSQPRDRSLLCAISGPPILVPRQKREPAPIGSGLKRGQHDEVKLRETRLGQDVGRDQTHRGKAENCQKRAVDQHVWKGVVRTA